MGRRVIGVDNLNDYYDTRLKHHRLDRLKATAGFEFAEVDLALPDALAPIVSKSPGSPIIHLAAQAGVRNSIQNPGKYVTSNLVGFANLAEFARKIDSPHVIYASTSSVYGLNTTLPFHESDNARHPLNLYSATKIANEVIAHAYSHLFAVPTTGLRFFTVYGPAGRPDMAPLIFTRKILRGETIDLFNGGQSTRDFTFIDDIVDAIVALVERPAAASKSFHSATPDPSISTAPFRIFNIGSGHPVAVIAFLQALEQALGRSAHVNLQPAQDGDMDSTHADTAALRTAIGWQPKTTLTAGVDALVAWCRDNPTLLGE